MRCLTLSKLREGVGDEVFQRASSITVHCVGDCCFLFFNLPNSKLLSILNL